MDKPAGPTSHDVVVAVRRAIGTRRVGHIGTLDPFAEGLLPVLVGRATRLAPYLVDLPKTYTGVLRLGARTDTDDLDGAIVETSESWRDVSDRRLDDAIASLTGTVEQVPPRYSAKKVGGMPAYRRARRGEPVTLPARAVHVRQFARTGRAGPDVTFIAAVASGTYVRALARDLGERLGCGAHLIALRRTVVGPFSVDDATPLGAIEHGAVALRPALEAVAHLPIVDLAPEERDAVGHGRPVPARPQREGPAALVADGALVAVAEAGDGMWRPRVVLQAT